MYDVCVCLNTSMYMCVWGGGKASVYISHLTQSNPAVKKSCCLQDANYGCCEKKMWNPRWWPRNVNNEKPGKFGAWIVIIPTTTAAISLPSQPLLGAPPCIFFHSGILGGQILFKFYFVIAYCEAGILSSLKLMFLSYSLHRQQYGVLLIVLCIIKSVKLKYPPFQLLIYYNLL